MMNNKQKQRDGEGGETPIAPQFRHSPEEWPCVLFAEMKVKGGRLAGYLRDCGPVGPGCQGDERRHDLQTLVRHSQQWLTVNSSTCHPSK